MISETTGSFRDPSGFLFYQDGQLYRQINRVYETDYQILMTSGLFSHLVEKKYVVNHRETAIIGPQPETFYKVILPDRIPFISYPYEWSFSQLKDAALLTLDIHRTALQYGMILKDASAYNIQFYQGKPIFIDTLSFEKHVEGEPWVAYRQFCQHFLAPLALMAYRDIRLSQLLRIHIDGIPLDMAAALLPFRSRFHFSLLLHLHLHAKAQKRYSTKKTTVSASHRLSPRAMTGLIDNLESAVHHLKWRPCRTEWAEYYEDTNYSGTALAHKAKIVADFTDHIQPETVWDLGANDGRFSRISNSRQIFTLSMDIDPAAVEKNYLTCKENKETYLIPLLLDLTNPPGGIGWENHERLSIWDRGYAEMVYALALIHHLAIGNNLPFSRIATFFKNICSHLIIEFVPKSDSQVKRLLVTRKDVFTDYHQDAFEQAFRNHFDIVDQIPIQGSERMMYLMSRKDHA